jgi:hypothetical protein
MLLADLILGSSLSHWCKLFWLSELLIMDKGGV